MRIRKMILPALAGMLFAALSLTGCEDPAQTEEAVNIAIIEEADEEADEALQEETGAEESSEQETDEPYESLENDNIEIEVLDDVDQIDYNGAYTTKEDVSLYLYTFGELPYNFMTKKEARALGWSGGPLEKYAPGYCIGGDYFGNNEGILPDGNYHECDIDTLYSMEGRGAKRIVYSDDGRIYYTEDHYSTFELLYGEE